MKEETKTVVKTVRSPADGAIAIAQGYKDGLTSVSYTLRLFGSISGMCTDGTAGRPLDAIYVTV